MKLCFTKSFFILLLSFNICQLTYAVDFDEQFPKIISVGHSSDNSWGGERPQGLFNCWGYDNRNSDKSVLNGIEFSFRRDTPASRTSACSNLFTISSAIITGKSKSGSLLKFANEIKPAGNFVYTIFLDNEDYPVEAISFLTASKSRFGWYRLNSTKGYEDTKTGFFQSQKTGFSNGVFSSPLSDLPSEGIFVYAGKASNPKLTTALVNNSSPIIDIATVNFAKNEVTINASMPHWDGSSIRIVSQKPMTFNKADGKFDGMVTIYGGSSVDKSYVNGFIGGINAEGIVLMLANGDAFSGNGTDFMIGAKK